MVSFTDHYNAISIDRLPSKTKTGKDSWKRFMKIILLCKPEFSSATKTSFFFIKNTKTTTLHQVTHGNTSNIVLKRMLESFLKVPPLKKILEFQNQKKTMKFVQKETSKPNIKLMIENLQNELYQ